MLYRLLIALCLIFVALLPFPSFAAVEQVCSGTGFFITSDGYFVTNNHVIEGADVLELKVGEKKYLATVVKADAQNDVAILKAEGSFACLPLGDDSLVRPGDEVFTVGFPMAQLMGEAPKTTLGAISALSGAQDDVRMFQTSVQIQPGNSGGPLVLKRSGSVVGITSSSINGIAFVRAGKSLPQNVNYAMKGCYIRPLLASTQGLLGKLTQVRADRIFREVQEDVEKSVGLVLVFKESDSSKETIPQVRETPSGEVPVASVKFVSRVIVSSALAPQRTRLEGAILYAPRNLFDGNTATAWVEGAEGRGIGEWVRVEFTRPVKLAGLRVFAGYGKSADIYAKNGRVKKLRLTIDGGKSYALDCEDVMDFNQFKLTEEHVISALQLEIVDVFPGRKYSDTAISEIVFK